jgi:hypothetical protein
MVMFFYMLGVWGLTTPKRLLGVLRNIIGGDFYNFFDICRGLMWLVFRLAEVLNLYFPGD